GALDGGGDQFPAILGAGSTMAQNSNIQRCPGCGGTCGCSEEHPTSREGKNPLIEEATDDADRRTTLAQLSVQRAPKIESNCTGAEADSIRKAITLGTAHCAAAGSELGPPMTAEAQQALLLSFAADDQKTADAVHLRLRKIVGGLPDADVACLRKGDLF